jgi:hypothetical protein
VGHAQLLLHWIPRTLPPWAKWQMSEAAHSSPSIAELRNKWSSISTALYAYMACRKITLPFSALITVLEGWNNAGV